MLVLQVPTIADLWVEVVSRCLRDGRRVLDDGETLFELLNVHFEIKEPLEPRTEIEQWYDQKMIADMHKNFHSLDPQFGYSVSYGARIYGRDGSSALAYVERLLARKPEAKSATMSLLWPDDYAGGHVPCIAALDFKARGGKLGVSYFARSQDSFKKSYADNLAIYEFAQTLAPRLDLVPGTISGVIASAHVYERDLVRIRAIPVLADAAAAPAD